MAEKYTAAVVTVSDRSFRGERPDGSGPVVKDLLEQAGYQVVRMEIVPDEQREIEGILVALADREDIALVVTTGGTGFAPRDVTPEATMAVAHRNAPGIAESIRAASMRITPRAMLSRGVSVIRGKTLIVNLPGSPKAVQESMDVFLDVIPHALTLLRGEGGECARK